MQHYHQNTRIGWQYADNSILTPTSSGKVSSWIRLAASEQSSGEWTPSIVDVLNSNPITQTDTDRRAAVGSSANGYPTMVFDGSDVHVWPLNNTINNMTTKLGFMLWFKPKTIASVQHLFSITTSAGGASAFKLDTYANNAQVFCECYISGANGRFGRTGNVLAEDTWANIYFQYDSSRGGDANLAIFINKTSQSLTYGNLGAGGTLTVLPQPTGNMFLGGLTNTDTPSQPIAVDGEVGPNIFAFNDNLNTFEIDNIFNFERPT